LPLVLAGRPASTDFDPLWFALGIPGAALGLWLGGRIRVYAVLLLTVFALTGVLLGIVR
jgi:hypothetical protein